MLYLYQKQMNKVDGDNVFTELILDIMQLEMRQMYVTWGQWRKYDKNEKTHPVIRVRSAYFFS